MKSTRSSSPVDHLVGGGLVKGVVKFERLVFQVLGEVHLLLWLVNQQGAVPRYGDHVYVLPGLLWCKESEVVSGFYKLIILGRNTITLT